MKSVLVTIAPAIDAFSMSRCARRARVSKASMYLRWANAEDPVSLNVDGMQITQSVAYASAMFDRLAPRARNEGDAQVPTKKVATSAARATACRMTR